MSYLEFEKKLSRYIEKEQLIKPGDRIAAAVSGGADSTALLYALLFLKKQNNISADLVCVHINHQLRGTDSDRDEKFVTELAVKLNVPVITRKVDVKEFAKNAKISIETAAREMRIKALIEIAKERGCNIIATGHQADDNAETVIHRLLRGTGFRGLCGIKPKNVFENGIIFVRPMLCFTRKNITDYLTAEELSWQTDATNFDCRYKRNFIRHQLLGELQKQSSKSVVELLSRLLQAAQSYQDSVSRISLRLWPVIASCQAEAVMLDINKFSQLHPAVKTELIYTALTNLGCGQRDLTQNHYEKILKLTQNCSGNKKIDLPCFFSVRKEYGNLIFEKLLLKDSQTRQFSEEIEVDVPMKIRTGNLFIETSLLDTGQFQIENFKKDKSEYIECFDYEKIIPPIIIRKRRTGDKFYPLGLAAEKRIGKFLTDQKIPSRIRNNILIVSDREKIIWLWPVRISEKVKVTNKTRKILQMQIKKE